MTESDYKLSREIKKVCDRGKRVRVYVKGELFDYPFSVYTVTMCLLKQGDKPREKKSENERHIDKDR